MLLEDGTLVEKLNETSLRSYLQEVLDVEENASMRQLKRARDKEAQKCQSDYLSEDKTKSNLAKQRLDEIHRAYDCLSSQRKFREYFNSCNDKILLGEAIVDDFLKPAEIETEIEAEIDDDTATDAAETNGDKESAQDQSAKSNIVPGPNPGMPTPVEPIEPGTTSGDNVISLREEKEYLKNLKKKHAEEDMQKVKARSTRIESLKKKTAKEIKEAATKEAKRRAKQLKVLEIEDGDQFYEDVFKTTKAATDKVKEEQIARMKRMDLPIDNNLLDDFATMSEESAEDATQKEFFALSQDGPLKRRKNSPIYLVMTALAGIAVFLFFINFAATMWEQLPDPVARQLNLPKEDGSQNTTDKGANPVDSNLSLSTYWWQARARGMAAIAGPAGMAGYANSLEIEGAANYNSGLNVSYERDYPKAIEQFKKSLARNKHLYQTNYNLASIYYWQGDAANSLTQYNETLKIRSDLAQANYNRGVIYLNLAQKTAKSTLDANNSKEEKKEQIDRATKLLHSAIAEFNSTIKKSPILAQPFYNRAIARYMLGDVKGTRKDLEEALKLNSKLASAKHNLSIAKSQLELPGKAPPKLDKKIPLGPEGPTGPPGPGYL